MDATYYNDSSPKPAEKLFDSVERFHYRNIRYGTKISGPVRAVRGTSMPGAGFCAGANDWDHLLEMSEFIA
jgi:hypothetical protein